MTPGAVLEPILMVILGWLLGLLAPVIVDQLKKPYRRKEIVTAILAELSEFQKLVTLAAWDARRRSGQMTDSFLDFAIQSLESCANPNPKVEELEVLKNLRLSRSETEERRISEYIKHRDPNSLPSSPHYFLPMSTALTLDLTICPLPFYLELLQIRHQLELLNQGSDKQAQWFEKTFDGLQGQNHSMLVRNLSKLAEENGARAEEMAKMIDSFRKKHKGLG